MLKTHTNSCSTLFESQRKKGFSIRIDQIDIALFKLSNGKIFAIENRSPHPNGGVLSKGLSAENTYIVLSMI